MLSLYRPTSCSVSIFVILPSWWLILISTSPLSLPVSTTGSEEGAVFPPVPWGVFAPGRVCLHGGHVALPLRLHHHVHSAPQVRRDKDLNLSCHKFKSQLQNFPSTSGHLGRCLCNRLICRLFFFFLPWWFYSLFLTPLPQILSWLWCESDAPGCRVKHCSLSD